MHVHLAPGEALPEDAQEELDRLFRDERVEHVLLPLRPVGEGAFPRAARRYLAEWDRRFVHRQNFYAPASRVASRAKLPGHRNADAAPFLARAIDEGRLVEALPTLAVETPVGQDLQRWLAWARDEGRAWGRLAAREPRFAPFLPVTSRRGWVRHNLLQAHRRTVEIHEAVKRLAPLVHLAHRTREAAFTHGCAEGFRG